MIILFSDLDRTLIPNGEQPESPSARPLLRELVESNMIRLVYVSGRDRDLVIQAMEEFHLPMPDFVIGDVGATLYQLHDEKWEESEPWQETIGADWNGHNHSDIVDLLESLDEPELELQPAAQQNTFKVSYFTGPGKSGRDLTDSVSELLEAKRINANLIWSIDEEKNVGLLDILPASASKIRAIRFLMEQEGIPENQAVFAGDSGNDLDALTSGLQAILVRNATDEVRREATEKLRKKNCESCLYLARGGLFSLNGNYAAGVIEGLVHFHPKLVNWMQKVTGSTPGPSRE